MFEQIFLDRFHRVGQRKLTSFGSTTLFTSFTGEFLFFFNVILYCSSSAMFVNPPGGLTAGAEDCDGESGDVFADDGAGAPRERDGDGAGAPATLPATNGALLSTV